MRMEKNSAKNRLIDLVHKHEHREDSEIIHIVLDAVKSWTGSPESVRRHDAAARPRGAVLLKILTAAQMRQVDRLTIERGIPGLVLMENAGNRVVDFLRETFAPLENQRIVVVCGKGNNGGDGFVVARQLFTRRLCRELIVLELFDPKDLTGDAAANRKMLDVCGCPVVRTLPENATLATIVVDAILGTGLTGPVKEGPALDGIRLVNHRFPLARKVAVDIPSGLPTDQRSRRRIRVQADYTVTFVAPKIGNTGRYVVAPIGTPADLCETNPEFRLSLTSLRDPSPFVCSPATGQ